MDTSIFLARFLGLYLFTFGLLWILFNRRFSVTLREVIASRGLIFFSGILGLLFGFALVLIHPSWNWNWDVAITIIGYVAIFQGIMRCAFVEEVQKVAADLLDTKKWIPIGICLLTGAYLIYHGFFTF